MSSQKAQHALHAVNAASQSGGGLWKLAGAAVVGLLAIASGNDPSEAAEIISEFNQK